MCSSSISKERFDPSLSYGLVLEGGGARGSYQIGVWKALRELKVDIQGVVGTSVGALNGALMIQDDFQAAHEVWHNMSYSKVMDVDDQAIESIKKIDWKKFNLKDLFSLKEEIKKLISLEGYDITPLKNLIRENIDENKIRSSGKDFGLVTYCLTDREPKELYIEDIPRGMLEDYLLASSYLPIFKTEKLHGKIYLDGGFHNKAPINMLIQKGYKNIILIRINGIGLEKPLLDKNVNLITIEAREDIGKLIDFTCQRARMNIELGYYDMLKFAYNLKGNFYYFHNNEMDENLYCRKFLNLLEKADANCLQILNMDSRNEFRKFFEKTLPDLADTLNLGERWTYENLYIKIFEYMGQRLGVNRFQLYTEKQFVSVVKTKITSLEKTSTLKKMYDTPLEKQLLCMIKEL